MNVLHRYEMDLDLLKAIEELLVVSDNVGSSLRTLATLVGLQLERYPPEIRERALQNFLEVVREGIAFAKKNMK